MSTKTRAGKRESSAHVLRRQRRNLAQVPKEPPDVLGSLMLPESPAGTSVSAFAQPKVSALIHVTSECTLKGYLCTYVALNATKTSVIMGHSSSAERKSSSFFSFYCSSLTCNPPTNTKFLPTTTSSVCPTHDSILPESPALTHQRPWKMDRHTRSPCVYLLASFMDHLTLFTYNTDPAVTLPLPYARA